MLVERCLLSIPQYPNNITGINYKRLNVAYLGIIA